MHPIIISDLCKIKRFSLVFFGIIAFVVIITALLRYYGGDFGLLLSLPFICIVIPAGMGGQFEEEMHKDRLRFLWTLPLSPQKMWFVKACNAFVVNVIFILLSLLILYLIPSRNDDISFLQPYYSELSSSDIFGWLFIFVSVVLYCFSGTLFISVIFNHTIMCAIFGAWYLSPIPLALLYLVFFCGFVPSLWELGLLIFIVAAVQFVESFVLFVNRNPFYDQPWKLRKIALATVLVAAVVIGLTFEAMGIRKRHGESLYLRNIVQFDVGPNSEKVLVTADKSLLLEFSYLLDQDGHLIADLGQVRPIYDAFTWSPMEPSRYFLGQNITALDFFTYSYGAPMILFDLLNGDSIEIENVNVELEDYQFIYRAWSQDGQYLLGEIYDYSQELEIKMYIFKQNIYTHNIELIETPFQDLSFLSGDRVLLKSSNDTLLEDGSPEPQEYFTVMDIHTQEKQRYTLPDHTIEWELTSDGSTLVALQRIPYFDYVEYQLISRQLDLEKETILIKSSELPRPKLKDLLDKNFGHTDLYFSPLYFSPRNLWVEFTHASKRFLVRLDQKTFYHRPLDEYNGDITYDPDENRICTRRYEVLEEDTPQEKTISHLDIYDWNGTDLKQVKSFEFPFSIYRLDFLGNDHILFIKYGENKGLENTNELWMLNLTTGNQRLFYSGISQVNRDE